MVMDSVMMEITLLDVTLMEEIAAETRGGVESNRTNFELIFIEFFELFFTFRINRIINFRIESNEFRTNPASEKFDSTL